MEHHLNQAEHAGRDQAAGVTQGRPALLLAWACLGVLLAAADLTALTSLIPQMTLDLQVPLPAGLTDAAWIVNAYLIGTIVALPISGRLADRVSRRVVFVGCLAIFIVGSIGSALAPTLWTLVAARAVQAIGAGAMVPVSMALATDVLPRNRWAFAFGLIGAVDTIGWAIGPLYGAAFVNFFSWRWLFWINVPLGLAVGAGALLALRGSVSVSSPRRIDWLGAALLTIGLTLLNIGLGRLGGGASIGISFDAAPPQAAWRTALPWVLGGLAVLAIFAVQQARATAPLITWRWLRRPAVAAAALLSVVFGVLLMAAVVNVPLYVNATMGGDGSDAAVQAAAVRSGLVLMALTGLMALGAPLGGALSQRVDARWVAAAGVVCAAIGFWFMRTWQPTTPVWTLCAHLLIVGTGFGLLLAPPAALIVEAAPPDERGLASSLVLLLRLSGMSLGLSLLTAWSINRFEALSQAVTLAELTGERIQNIIVAVLAAAFGVAAVLALGSLVFALLMRNRGRATPGADAPDVPA